MKIFKEERLKRIITLIRGTNEDREIACALLGSKEEPKRTTKYKIVIEKSDAYLWAQDSKGNWHILDSCKSYVETNPAARGAILARFQNHINKGIKPFEPETIYY